LIGHRDDLSHIRLHHHHVCHRNNLLGVGLKGAGFLGLGAQRLNGIHQLLRLIDERLAQSYRPLQVRIHLRDEFGKLRHCLHILIP
jgi:hypothetical protein